MTKPRCLAIAMLVASLACTRSPDVGSVRAALLDADRAFSRATAARRADGWMEFMAADGAMIRPAGTLTGTAAVHDQISKQFSDTTFTLTWEPHTADVGASGDLGYTVGSWEARFRTEQREQAVRTGRYLTVWKKQADGSWKVVQDIGVQDPVPAAQ